MQVKPTHNLILLLLTLRGGLASSRLISSRQVNISLIPNVENQPSRPGKAQQQQQNGKDSSAHHISDFTDPDTGLNPFLDLQEGRTSAFGRRFKDQDRPLPRPPVTEDDIVEGESDSVRPRVGGDGRSILPPESRLSSRMNANPKWRSSWNDNHHQQQPTKSEKHQWDHQNHRFHSGKFAETTSSEHSIDTTSTETRSSIDTTTTVTTTSTAGLATTSTAETIQLLLDSTGSSELSDVRDVDDNAVSVTSSPENPLANGVTSGALIITGSVVAGVALVLVIVALFACKRLRNRNSLTDSSSPSAAAAYVESRNCEGSTTSYSPSTNGRDSKART